MNPNLPFLVPSFKKWNICVQEAACELTTICPRQLYNFLVLYTDETFVV